MKKSTTCEEFALQVSRMAVAHMCRANFKKIDASALETMGDLLASYLESLGRAAKQYTQISGREKGTMRDLLQAFADKHPKTKIKDIQWTLSCYTELEKPFAHDMLDFPRSASDDTAKPKAASSSPTSRRQRSLLKNAPSFLPDLPPTYTYRSTEVDSITPNTDVKMLRQERLRQNRQMQSSLNRLYGTAASSAADSSASILGASQKRKWGEVSASSAEPEGMMAIEGKGGASSMGTKNAGDAIHGVRMGICGATVGPGHKMSSSMATRTAIPAATAARKRQRGKSHIGNLYLSAPVPQLQAAAEAERIAAGGGNLMHQMRNSNNGIDNGTQLPHSRTFQSKQQEILNGTYKENSER